MAVSVAGAKSLVSEWMGTDVFDDDEEDDVVKRLLGYAEKAKPAPLEKNQALERLRARMNHKKPVAKAVVAEESSGEEESKSASIGKRKNVKSVLDTYKKHKKRKN